MVGDACTAQVGIQPDLVLDLEHMPPADGPGFCKFIASADAPPLFGISGSSTSRAVADPALVASK
jgi:hypothetical protein